jgi:hypothetical protein
MTCHLSDQILNIIVVDEKSNLLVFYKKRKIISTQNTHGTPRNQHFNLTNPKNDPNHKINMEKIIYT